MQFIHFFYLFRAEKITQFKCLIQIPQQMKQSRKTPPSWNFRKVTSEDEFSFFKLIFSEFEVSGCDALMISEVFLLLDHRRKQSEQKEEIEDISDVFLKTLNYTRRLSKFKSRETIRSVRGLFFKRIYLKINVKNKLI